MSTSTSPIFNGTSTFSNDFAQVVSRAVSIASLPITGLTSQKTTLTSEQSALSNLSGSFSALQSAVAALGTAVGSGNYALSYSDNSVASASASSGALLGTYNLEVDDTGSQARAASAATVTDPTTENISTSASFTLIANGQQYSNIMPPPDSNTLTSLVSAINTATQGAVQATIVNIGTASNPSYQLSIQNSSYGDLPISLDDGTGNILNDPTTATSVTYRVNGQPDTSQDPLSSDTRTISLSPGLTATVLNTGTTDITVGQSTNSIANAMNGLVAAYNAASKAVDGQRGTAGGALNGQSVVNTLSQSLQALTNYAGTGSIRSIADLGLTLDKNGVLSFDPTVLSAAAKDDFRSVTDFLGSPTAGGFLLAATSTLTSVLDSSSGVIPSGLSAIAGEIGSTDDQINTNQDRVDQLQKSLTAQMAAADALIAQMQQQVTYLTSMFNAMTANQYTNK